MSIGRDYAIFKQLDSDKFTDEQKVYAIYNVLTMETHNGIYKDDLLAAIRWLLNQNYDIEKAVSGDA